MSFGCSFGDIVLLSQLSLQIYNSVTTGRKNATRDLAELGDVLFGLRCALDHLRNVANDISKTATASKSGDTHGAEMRNRLDQMVRNCATTLEDLDSVTRKYREGAQEGDNDDDCLDDKSSQTRRMKLKRRLASNFMKVRWDMDKDTLRIYRDKLQSHTDAINLVLNTFLWYDGLELFLLARIQIVVAVSRDQSNCVLGQPPTKFMPMARSTPKRFHIFTKRWSPQIRPLNS
jgi:hypothetical protein